MRSRLKVKVEKRAASRRGHEGREQNQATNCNLTTHEFKQASHDQEEGHDARQHHDGGLEDRDLVGAAAGHRRGKWRRREGEVLFSLRSMTLGQRRKKKSARGSLEGKRGERNKNKSKRASRKKKRPSLSPSPCSLLKKKKAGEASRKKTPRSVSPSILFESLPEPFNKNALRPPVPRSLRGGSRVHGTAVGSVCGLRLCPCPHPLLSPLPLKKDIRVCIPLRSRWSTFSRPFPHGTSRALLFVLPFGRKRPEKGHARALWPADHSSETVYRSRIVL